MKTQFIREASLKKDGITDFGVYPFSLGVVRNLESLEFHEKVTFLIGENGIGKSTLLEAIAIAYGFNPEGGSKNFNFSTNNTHSILHEHIKLIKGIRIPKDNFFLRGDTIYNFATQVDLLGSTVLRSYGGKSLHTVSHGESFLSIFIHRLGGNGLYLIDEPETALSITSQMAVVSRIHQLVNQGSQFIICTHSPIILSYPDAIIYQIDKSGIHSVVYDETEIVSLYRSFILNKKNVLKELLR